MVQIGHIVGIQRFKALTVIASFSLGLTGCGYKLATGADHTTLLQPTAADTLLVCIQTVPATANLMQRYAKPIDIPLGQLSVKLAIHGVNNQVQDGQPCPNPQLNRLQLVLTEALQSETQFSGAIKEVSQTQWLHYYWYSPVQALSEANPLPQQRSIEATVQFQNLYTQGDESNTQYRIAAQTLTQKLLDKTAVRIRTEWSQLVNACGDNRQNCVAP